MKARGLLAAFLLGVGLCFVPALGYGEVQHWMYYSKASYMKVEFLTAKVDYMMHNPTNFLNVTFLYDPSEKFAKKYFPEGVHVKGKIYVDVSDSRGVFSYKSGIALLDQFKKEWEVIYSFIKYIATDMDTDILAIFYSREDIPLGYFYQGEYHLWER